MLDNPRKLYSVIQQDLPASNGIIHIIDQPITPTDSSPRDEQVSKYTNDVKLPENTKKKKTEKSLNNS